MNASSSSYFLRRALLVNGTFSLISGIVLIIAATPLSELFGLAIPGILVFLGLALLVYAAALFRNALRERISQTEALLAVILDTAWVIGSATVIFAGLLNTTGNWTVAIVADIVLLFGVLQFYGLRRIRHIEEGPKSYGSCFHPAAEHNLGFGQIRSPGELVRSARPESTAPFRRADSAHIGS